MLELLVHIWRYNQYPGYTETLSRLSNDSVHQTFKKRLAPMLRSRENQIVLEFSFWEAAEEVKDPEGIYELRSYLLKVFAFELTVTLMYLLLHYEFSQDNS